MWDYDVDDNQPFFFQQLIGHTSSPACLVSGNQIVSAAVGDGVHTFDFHGDLTTDFNPKRISPEQSKPIGHTPSGLDKIMRSVS